MRLDFRAIRKKTVLWKLFISLFIINEDALGILLQDLKNVSTVLYNFFYSKHIYIFIYRNAYMYVCTSNILTYIYCFSFSLYTCMYVYVSLREYIKNTYSINIIASCHAGLLFSLLHYTRNWFLIRLKSALQFLLT